MVEFTAGRPVKKGRKLEIFSSLYLDDFFCPFLHNCKKRAFFNEKFLPHLCEMIYKKGVYILPSSNSKPLSAAIDVVLKTTKRQISKVKKNYS